MSDELYSLCISSLELLLLAVVPLLAGLVAISFVSSAIQASLGVREEALGLALRVLLVTALVLLLGAQFVEYFSELLLQSLGVG